MEWEAIEASLMAVCDELVPRPVVVYRVAKRGYGFGLKWDDLMVVDVWPSLVPHLVTNFVLYHRGIPGDYLSRACVAGDTMIEFVARVLPWLARHDVLRKSRVNK